MTVLTSPERRFTSSNIQVVNIHVHQSVIMCQM